MTYKVTKKWADSIADGTHELFEVLNAVTGDKKPPARIVRLSDLFREGQSILEVSVKLEIGRATYYRACHKSKSFKEEHLYGLERSEAWWATLGRAGAAGKVKIQPASWIFNMKNRFNWSDKKELTTRTTELENETVKPDMTPQDASKIYNEELLKKV